MQIEYVADGQIRHVTAELSSLPGAEHFYEAPQWEFDQYTLVDTWRFANIDNPRAYQLRTEPLFQSVVPDPMVTSDDFQIGIEVEHAMTVRIDDVNVTTTEAVGLYQPWQPTDQDVLEDCSFDDPNTDVSVAVQYYVRWSMMAASC